MVVFSGCDFNTHKWLNEECPQVGSAMGRRHFTDELKHQVAPSEESRGKRCTSPHPAVSPIAHMPPGSPVKQPVKRRGTSPAQRFTSGVLPMEPEAALPTTSRDPPRSSLAGYSVGPLPSRPAEEDHPIHTARRMAKFPICSPPPPPAPKPEGIVRHNPNTSPVVPAPAKQTRRTKGPGTANLTRSSSIEQIRTGRKMVGIERSNNSLSRSHSKDDLMPVNSWCPLSSSKKHIPGRHPTQESSPMAIHPRVPGKRQSGRSNSPDSLSIGAGRSDPAGSPGPDTPRGGRRLYGEAVQSSRLVSTALHHAPPSASRLAARPHTGLRTESRERSSSPFLFGSGDDAGRSKGIKCNPRSYSPLW